MSLSGKNRSKTKVLKTVSAAPERKALENSRTRQLGIGIRNPYALADIISHGESRGWCCRPAKLNRTILEKYLGIPYKKLFDPASGSPLFGAKTLARFGFESEKGSPRSYKKKETDKKETSGGGLALGDEKGSVEECEKGSGEWTKMSDSRWSIETDLAGKVDDAPPMFDDPVQGPVPDCYYEAVLASLAWHNLINFKQNYIITFNDAKNGNRPYGTAAKTLRSPKNYRKISTDLPLNTLGEPAFSHSKDANEIWAPFYEKAYACYLEDTGIIPAGKDPDQPQVCRIPEGDACTALSLLTGKKPAKIQCSSYARDDVTGFRNDFMKIIDTSLGAMSMRTLYPTVAYTYCSGDPDRTGKPLDLSSAPQGSGVLYEDDVVPANHAFSVLGFHYDAEGEYVILRNPYGPDCGSCMTKLPYTIAETDLKFPALYYSLQDPKHIPGVRNGVFALTVEDFLIWFRGYCWAVV